LNDSNFERLSLLENVTLICNHWAAYHVELLWS